MLFIRVFDNGHLKLPRQAYDRRRGQNHHGNPAVAEGFAGMDVQSRCLGIGKDRIHAAPDIDDENANGEQRRELYDSLKRDRRHHAVVLLLGVHVARAE